MAGNCKAHKKQFTFKWQLKFIAMIFFTAILFLLKVIIGHLSNSMALVADSFHMITDFAVLTIGYMALRLANSTTEKGKLDSEKFTFGWVRAEVLGGLINTVFLFALCFSVLVASLQRFVEPETITKPIPVLIVGIVSLVVNFLGLFLFRASRDNICQCCFGSQKRKAAAEEVSLMKKHRKDNESESEERIEKYVEKAKELTWQNEHQTPHSLNIRGVYLHILEHFFASSIVIVSALIVMYVKGSWTKYVDPGFTIIVVLMILHSTIPLFRETIILFMQSVPADIKVKDMEERLLRKVPSVLSVHEFHVWHLGGEKIVASAHVLFKCPDDYVKACEEVQTFFQNEGIACMTFQPEFLPKEHLEEYNNSSVLSPSYGCFYTCSKDETCKTFTCCGAEENSNHCENHKLMMAPAIVTYETGI